MPLTPAPIVMTVIVAVGVDAAVAADAPNTAVNVEMARRGKGARTAMPTQSVGIARHDASGATARSVAIGVSVVSAASVASAMQTEPSARTAPSAAADVSAVM